MVSILRNNEPSSKVIKSNIAAMAALVAVASGGCSADIARFDFPSANLTDTGQTTTSAIPTPPEAVVARSNLGADQAAVAGHQSSGGAYVPSSSNYQPSTPAVSVSTLPDPVQPAATTPAPASTPSSVRYAAAPVSPSSYSPPAAPSVPAVAPITASQATGEQIEVRQGDTLFGLSKRHKVAVSELMSVNGLSSPTLKPGQKLMLPASKASREPLPKSPAETAALAPVDAPADWTGTYTVKTGDSLYAIARRNNVKFTDLQKYNGIQDVRRVKPGAILKVPGSAGEVAAAQRVTAAAPLVAAAPVTASGPPAEPTIINSTTVTPPAATPPAEQKVAALEDAMTANDATPAAAPPTSGSVAEAGKLRWPVQGKIIAPFGPRADGTHNDGINVAVPVGTDVHAAESGVVAYSGSELKGYGNLVLLRHDNGWVTAYAHADELKVKRGDRVRRGQVIAKAGKTGQVDQPQLHFEVRQGQKPVDPTPFLEKL